MVPQKQQRFQRDLRRQFRVLPALPGRCRFVVFYWQHRIFVQVQPFIQGKKYTGITIMMESEPIKIDLKLEEQLEQFMNHKQKSFSGRIEAIFSQDSKYQNMEFPLQVKLQIQDSTIILSSQQKQIQKIAITQDFPNIQFIRKSFNSILFNFSANQSMKLALNNNFNRDLFALIVRTMSIQAHYKIDVNPQSKEEKIIKEQQSSSQEIVNQVKSAEQIQIKQSSQQQKQSSQSIEIQQKIQAVIVTQQEQKPMKEAPKGGNNTMLILKLDQQAKQLKSSRREYDQLLVNYNIQKKSKKQLQNQIDLLKSKYETLNKAHQQSSLVVNKVKKVTQDNRFYRNQIAIMKKELKAQKQKNQLLQQKLKGSTQQAQENHKQQVQKLIKKLQICQIQVQSALKQKQQSNLNTQKYKQQTQRLQNQNQNLTKKLTSLMTQKQIFPSKHLNDLKQKKTIYNQQSQNKVKELQMKLKNLQMLLRYKTSQNDQSGSSGLQMLVANLTQTITEKQLQINDLKQVNKNLVMQLKEIKEKQENYQNYNSKQ